jgi:predicted glycosyltransferase involved in capsule biosynthesis
MNKASIIIPFCEARTSNLLQTLRFFCKRNKSLSSDSELIIVCQNYCKKEKIDFDFKKIKIIELGAEDYCRAKMCNIGAKESTNDLLILLDSDRILPHGYFETVCSKILPNQCISTYNLWQIEKEVNDDDIESQNYPCHPDYKSVRNEMHRKGMFSGNTVLFRYKYLNAGMMDESYVGYGYQDIDFERKMINFGLEMIFGDEKELHLHHSKNTSESSKMTVLNGIKYCQKWNLKPEKSLVDIGHSMAIDVINEVYKIKVL